jgi:hypothetical protein
LELLFDGVVLELFVVDLGNHVFRLLLLVSSQVGLLLRFSLDLFQILDGVTSNEDLLVKFFRLLAGLGKILLESIVFFIQGANLPLKVFCLIQQFFLLVLEVLLMRIIVNIPSQKLLHLPLLIEDLLILLNQELL